MDPTTLAYIAGFLDGDGSIFFQIIPRKDYKQKFQIRCSIAFYQKKENAEILVWLKNLFGAGYIRHRKTGMSDYTVVEPTEVEKILTLLQTYVKLKRKHIDLGLRILQQLKHMRSNKDFIEVCKLVDEFGKINYSKKRTITYKVVEDYFKNKSLPP